MTESNNIQKALKVLSNFENRRVIENETTIYKGYPSPEKKYFKLTRQLMWDLFNQHKPKGYKINSRNEKVVYTMLRYFCEDQNFDKQNIVKNESSLAKGILITGPFGIGKSVIFDIIQKMGKDLAIEYGYMGLWFKSISAGDFTETYMREASRNDSTFKLENFYKGKLYIDDLGIEDKAFNRTEIFEKLLFERHRAQIAETSKPYQERKIKTFISTNLKPSEITNRYGDRIGDRLGEMFNIINWEGESWRD